MPAIPQKPKATGDDRNLVPVDENYIAPGLEDKLRLFWEHNSRLVLAAVAAIALLIVGREAYGHIAAQHELAIGEAYAAATTDNALKSFITEHPGHALAGVAQLRLADNAYTAGRFPEAQSGYEQALPLLKDTPFAPRAQLGAAAAQLEAGQTAPALAALRQIVGSATMPKAIRAAAAYDLAAQAAEAGHADEVGPLVEQVINLDPNRNSPVVELALSLQARQTPAAATASSSSPTPAPPAPKAATPDALAFPAAPSLPK